MPRAKPKEKLEVTNPNGNQGIVIRITMLQLHTYRMIKIEKIENTMRKTKHEKCSSTTHGTVKLSDQFGKTSYLLKAHIQW